MKIRTIIIAVIVIATLLGWCGLSIYNKGYAAAEAVYQKKAAQTAFQKVENTEKLEAEKQKLKQREKNLDADCKALYSLDLSACRRQLRGKH